MEAIELYKEEHLKQLEYEEECKTAGKKVTAYNVHYHFSTAKNKNSVTVLAISVMHLEC